MQAGKGKVGGRVALTASLSGAVLLAACQTAGPPAMSIEEAKRITAALGGGAFVAPPRTINDITAILDQQKLADPEAAAQARAKADQPPPNTTDPDALARFYYHRGLAAGEIGRARQEIDDLTEGARWAARGSGRDEHEMLFWLSIAEITGGNFSRSIESTRRAIGKVPRSQQGWLVPLYGNLASLHARAGDMQAAEAALRESVRAFNESRTWWIFYPAEGIAAVNAGLAEAQASVLVAKGQLAEAETFYRQAVAAVAGDAVLSKRPWLDYLIGRLAEVLVRQGRLITPIRHLAGHPAGPPAGRPQPPPVCRLRRSVLQPGAGATRDPGESPRPGGRPGEAGPADRAPQRAPDADI